MKYDLTSTDALFARNVRFAKNVIRESLESKGENAPLLLSSEGD
jgi:hypothetical protein